MKKLLLLIFLSLTNYIWAQQPRLVLPVGHTESVNTTCFSPNGKKLITVSEDYTAKIWDVETGLLLIDLKGHTGPVNAAHFSAIGDKVVTASQDATVKLWDVYSGNLIREFTAHTSMLSTVAFSPEGNRIVTASWDNTAKVFDIETGNLIVNIVENDWIGSAWFSPDGKKILTVSGDISKLWDADSGKLLLELKGHSAKVKSAEFSSDGRQVVTASFDKTAKIWDTESGKIQMEFKGHTAALSSASFSSNGEKIITTSWDSTTKVWESISGKAIAELKSHTRQVDGAKFSPDNKKVISFSQDNTAKLWDVTNGDLIADLMGHDSWVSSAVFSPDGKKIATSSWDKTVKIWNSSIGNCLKTLNGKTSDVSFAQFSSDASWLLVSSKDHSARIWEEVTGSLSAVLKGNTKKNQSEIFVFDGKHIGNIFGDKTSRMWDTLTHAFFKTPVHDEEEINFAQLSVDGKKILTKGASAKIWNSETGGLLIEISGGVSGFNTVRFSPSGKEIVTASWSNRSVKIWNTETGNFVIEMNGKDRFITAEFSPDGKKIVTACDGTGKVWDAATGNMLTDLKDDSTSLDFAKFSPDGKLIVTASYPFAKIWDAETGILLTTLEIDNDINTAHFSPDGKKIVIAADNNNASIWDVITGKLLNELKGHTNWVRSAEFSPDGKRIITASDDNSVKIWNSENAGLLFSLYIIDSSDYLIQLPTKYYLSTPGAVKQIHYVTDKSKIITFEQLDVKYNRPDKVLESLGNTDTSLINSYRCAWEKRIKKLRIDTTAFREDYSVPEADFANRENVEHEHRNETLSLHIKGVDSTYPLDRYNIWVNEAPLFGQRGISIKIKNLNIIDTTITIKLSQGENKIETSITNMNGTESYRMPLVVNYTPANKQTEKTYFIGIGIDKFAESKYNLHYSTKDIRDLAKKLKEKYGNDIIIDTLFNEKVTVRNIKSLKQKLLQTTVNDKVIISYSGHGMLSKDFDYYLSTYAVNFEKPEENGLPYDELENLLDSIPARKKLMFIDACHSGEVDKDDLIALNATDNKLIKGLKPVAYKNQGQLGLKNSFDLMQSLFVNVGKSTGATIISAAAGTQFALEGINNLPNGVFTYCILEAMEKNKSIKISELKKTVGERVVELTKGLQKPTSRNETIAVDWEL